MSTFGTIKQRVADEMKRGEITASSTAVQTSVLDAIKFYEKRTMWFNEAVDTSQVTVADAATLSAMPTGLIRINSFKVTVSGSDVVIDPMNYNTMDAIDSKVTTGRPDYYAIYGDKIRLYPTPNASYTCTISFIKRLPEISASATTNATNAWVNECEGMIRKRAKGELFQNELRNYNEASYWFGESEKEYNELNRQNVGRRSGYIKPTQF